MRSLAAIYLGRPAVLLPIFEPGAALDAIERFRCAYTFGLPALLQFVVEEQLQEARDTTSLRTVIAGGDCVPVKLQERFADIFGVRLHEGIGMSETYPIAFNRKGAIRLGSLGVPSPGVELSFEDADDRMLEDGEIGEIVVQSPANCIGYWNALLRRRPCCAAVGCIRATLELATMTATCGLRDARRKSLSTRLQHLSTIRTIIQQPVSSMSTT